tara:strand:+ start:222 stop:416 length:195 start_codon:yes stop_codon:yes gene_type:complete
MKIEFLETTWFQGEVRKKGTTIEASEKEVTQVLNEGLAVAIDFDTKKSTAKATRVEKSKVTRKK